MDIEKGNIFKLLNGNYQYIVPVYQRKYSWLSDKQCERLWRDIVRMEQTEKKHHFVGSIVNIVEKNAPMGINKYLVIDGQQRMTTLSILMIALRDYIKDNPCEDVNENTLTYYMLKNDHQSGDDRYKMLLNDYDKKIFINLVDGLKVEESEESNIYKNYLFFKEKISAGELTPGQVYKSVEKLQIVSITLSKEDGDEPQVIFESLNSTGMDLSQSDLIRNFILMDLSNDEQNDIYNNYWMPMENSFSKENRSSNMDKFFRDYLTMRLGRIPRVEEVYEEFKLYSVNSSFADTKEFAEDIMLYGKCYTEIILKNSPDNEFNILFDEMEKVRMEVSYPFLLRVYGDFKKGVIDKEVFIAIVKMTISYVVRRSICEIPTNSLNKTFATILRNAIKTSDYLNSVAVAFLQLDTYKEFPTDDEFKQCFKNREIYKMRISNYILVKLENYDNKEPIPYSGFTIEHIMPQNENLNDDWRKALGDNWEEAHATHLHRIGNLTLTKYNSEMSDRSFKEKLPIFKQSATHTLNKYVVEQERWDISKIIERTEKLVDDAVRIWAYPTVPYDVMAQYAVKDSSKEERYSLETYEYFDNIFIQMLFEKLDTAILSLNPMIKREFKKLYIAYKYKTNVADVVIQKSRLRISVNIPFATVDDPTGICKNVAGLGRWGNGEVEIGFDSLEMLPKTLEIINQSLERQL